MARSTKVIAIELSNEMARFALESERAKSVADVLRAIDKYTPRILALRVELKESKSGS